MFDTRDLNKYPPTYKVGDVLHWTDYSFTPHLVEILEIDSANKNYDAETMEEHISLDTYKISYYKKGQKCIEYVFTKDLMNDQEFEQWEKDNKES